MFYFIYFSFLPLSAEYFQDKQNNILLLLILFFQVLGRFGPSALRLHSGRGGSIANKLRIGFAEHFKMRLSHEQ